MDIESLSNKSSTQKLGAKNQFRVLIIDDDRALLDLLDEFFKSIGFQTETSETAEMGIEKVLYENRDFDLIICDFNLPEKNGLDFIEEIKVSEVETPVILITAFGTMDDAATALKRGAYDYITKPLNFTELEVLSQRAIKIRNLEKNYERLRKKLGVDSEETRLLGSGAKMRELKVIISKISQSHSNVLITGESGSGKEMVARSIHENSDRRENPFIPINCSAIPQDLLEAELFGYKKGT